MCSSDLGNGAVALAAMLYPTPVRATGMGWAVSFARLGQVASSILAGMMIGAGLTPEKIFALIGSSALVAALAVVVIWVRNPQRY